MKTRIAIFAFIAVGAMVISACAPAVVERFGDTQSIIQDFAPTSTGGIEDEMRSFFFPNDIFGIFDQFDFDYYFAKQKPKMFDLPYNPDATLTALKTDGFQVKLISV